MGMLFGVPLVYLVCAADSVTPGLLRGRCPILDLAEHEWVPRGRGDLGRAGGPGYGPRQARLRWLLGSLLVAPLSVLAIWLYLRFQWGADITSIVVKDGCFDLPRLRNDRDRTGDHSRSARLGDAPLRAQEAAAALSVGA